MFYKILTLCIFGLNYEVELKFNDNSVIKCELITKSVTIQTDYGELTIPTKDIKQIDFGCHILPEIESKIDQAIEKLKSFKFKERDEATNELIILRKYSFRKIIVYKTADKEVMERLKVIENKIRSLIPEESLYVRDFDIIIAKKLTVTGKITNVKLKFNNENLGMLELSLQGMRTLIMNNVGFKIVVVKAGKQWTDSKIILDGFHSTKIKATGSIDLWPQGPGQYINGPAGNKNIEKHGGFTSGQLIGRIGRHGVEFVIGSNCEIKTEGRLYLQIVPNPWGSESFGEYIVEVSK